MYCKQYKFAESEEYDQFLTELMDKEFMKEDEHEGDEVKEEDTSEDHESTSLRPTLTEQPGYIYSSTDPQFIEMIHTNYNYEKILFFALIEN